LFNTLTNAQVFANAQLFATLDSTIRRITLPASGVAVIADTVGFIQNLPHDLVDAFKSTLEETKRANVLLHIVDAADEYNIEKIAQVEDIIFQIGASNIPSILVMNKIDCLGNFVPRADRDENGRIYRVWLSAQTAQGINFLHQALAEQLSGMMTHAKIRLDVNSAYIRSNIHNIGHIRHEKVDDFGAWVLEIFVTKHYLSKLLNFKGVTLLWEQSSSTNKLI
jgi:GTP-binding protein HflX